MRKTYINPYDIEFHDQGKDTGPETITEQEYLPTAVQVQRFINAGELLKASKKEMYDIGWDEDFNINKVSVNPINRQNFGMVEMQEELENAVERIQESQRTTQNSTGTSTEETGESNNQNSDPPEPEPPKTVETV